MGGIFVALILVLSVLGLLLFFINKVLRNWLNVEKKKMFSYAHVNDKHKKLTGPLELHLLYLCLSVFSLMLYVIL